MGISICDLAAAMDAVLERVRADAGGAGPDVTLRADAEFGDPGGDPPGVGQVVVAVGGSRTVAGFGHGLEHACAQVMGVVQDEVVASLWRPWPEIAGVGVLDVAPAPVGIAHWTLRGEPVCPVGALTSSCRSLGWRLR